MQRDSDGAWGRVSQSDQVRPGTGPSQDKVGGSIDVKAGLGVWEGECYGLTVCAQGGPTLGQPTWVCEYKVTLLDAKELGLAQNS